MSAPAALHLADDEINGLAEHWAESGEIGTLPGHAASCEECAAQVERIARVIRAASTLRTSVAPPPGLWRRVSKRTIAAPRWLRAARRVRRPALAGLLMLLVATLVGQSLSRIPPADVRARAISAEQRRALAEYESGEPRATAVPSTGISPMDRLVRRREAATRYRAASLEERVLARLAPVIVRGDALWDALSRQ
jgi:hypothetical protein